MWSLWTTHWQVCDVYIVTSSHSQFPEYYYYALRQQVHLNWMRDAGLQAFIMFRTVWYDEMHELLMAFYMECVMENTVVHTLHTMR